ncbi:MAG: nucleoside/nucleotide kinase family protein [Nocardioidaceae bacterium]
MPYDLADRGGWSIVPSGSDRAISLAELAAAVAVRAARRPDPGLRYVLGIAGPPAAGKTTLSIALRDELNRRSGRRLAEIAPMDGFHLSNARLQADDALDRKGEPDTFDAAGYARRLTSVRHDGDADVAWPTFDRSIEATVPGGVVFTPDVQIAITEGNYVLLDTGDWASVRTVLDEAWFVDADLDLLESRLIVRHRQGGKSAAAARAKTTRSDLPNARLVGPTRQRARLVLHVGDGPIDQAIRLVTTAADPVSDDTTGAIS